MTVKHCDHSEQGEPNYSELTQHASLGVTVGACARVLWTDDSQRDDQCSRRLTNYKIYALVSTLKAQDVTVGPATTGVAALSTPTQQALGSGGPQVAALACSLKVQGPHVVQLECVRVRVWEGGKGEEGRGGRGVA